MAPKKQSHQKWLCATLLGILLLSACGGKNRLPPQGASAEPDKVLFERAQEDVRKGRYTVARLTATTLINTYPDSEYLAKAALLIADSYYKEGGTAGLTQAVQEYENFITFFPFLPEAEYAQMQIALCHYRRMEKPDRDRTFARLAEEALQRFLLKYPDGEKTVEARQRLREVQEVLAEGEFRIAWWYYRKGALRAMAARLMDLAERYPLYSQSDRALWLLADAFERGERGDIASKYYERIVRDYPLSPHAEDAKGKLTALGVPIPQPNPEALARMQKERECDRERPGMLRRSLGMFRSGPNVSSAACGGEPNLNPPAEPISPLNIITTPRPDLQIEGQPGGTTGSGATGSGGSTGSSTPEGASPAGTDSSKAELEATGKKKKEEEEKKKKEEEEKKKQESSSKKKKKKN